MNDVFRIDQMNFSLANEILSSVGDGDRLLKCIQCGTCTGTCPAAGGMERTPREIARMVQLGLVEEALRSQVFWNCVGCASCKLKCPRGVPLADLMTTLRAEFTRRIGVPESMAALSDALERTNNITGDPPENKLLWLKNMEQPALEGRIGRGAEVAFFTGCVSSLFPMVYGIPQSFVRILEASGIEYCVLGSDEWCCGFPLLAAGMPDKLERLARHNVETLREMGVRTLVTTCPSCFHTWKWDYLEIVGKLPFRVLHSSEF
ncbi:MAG TPA: (Fe-S)-binding protein, partial [Firmicutes bacterium]|nr:(Fe-S)-binding protein [Bacillota bacterium]